jgi:hypothetical protein
MKFRISVLIILLFLLFPDAEKLQAQENTRLRISLLTCTAGEELYSIFGHSALRIIDSNSVSDIVYNYGTFNFNDEGFYLKFIRGKLKYYISIENTSDFIYTYRTEGRGITEQVLMLSNEEAYNIQHALNENLKEENKFYAYDFFLDNCTTRLRDLILKHKNPQPALPAVMPLKTSFRDAIHFYLKAGKQNWSMLGIDILLGKPTDQLMTSSQQQFLPDNLMKALDSCSNTQLVSSSKSLYNLPEKASSTRLFTPLVFFIALLALSFLWSFSKIPFLKISQEYFDGFLFFLTGLLGLILVLMWTSTDHSMTKVNFNLLWAWPFHMLIAFMLNSKKRWVKQYLHFYSLLMCLLLLAWFFLPEKMNNALIPFVLTLAYRARIRSLK